MDLTEILWNNVPENLKTDDAIKEFIEVAGEIFEEEREKIEQRKWLSDYAETDASNLIDLGNSLGLRFPRNISDPLKRRIIRDVRPIYARLGTRAGLDWALKTLGLSNYRVDEVWVQNPDLIRKGYFRDVTDTEESRYTVSSSSYTDWMVGEAVVKENGTFFEGWRYEESEELNEVNKYTDIPIYGETYKNYNQIDSTNMVAKTPYVIVRVFEEDYDIVVSDYTDPETGEEYSYTPSERSDIITKLISYFIQDLQRTATVRVFFVTATEFLSSTMPRITDSNFEMFEEQAASIFEDFIAQVQDTLFEKDLSERADTLVIGSNDPIGVGLVPYFGTGSYVKLETIADYGSGLRTTYPVTQDRQVLSSGKVLAKNETREGFAFLDFGATVNATFSGAGSVDVYARVNFFSSNSSDDVFLATLTDLDSTNFTNLDAYHVLRFVVTSNDSSNYSELQYNISY